MRTIIGQVVGRYRIESMLAQGGVGRLSDVAELLVSS
jgi:hypothetical protein